MEEQNFKTSISLNVRDWTPLPFKLKSQHLKSCNIQLYLFSGLVLADQSDPGELLITGHLITSLITGGDPGLGQLGKGEATGLGWGRGRGCGRGDHLAGSPGHSVYDHGGLLVRRGVGGLEGARLVDARQHHQHWNTVVVRGEVYRASKPSESRGGNTGSRGW